MIKNMHPGGKRLIALFLTLLIVYGGVIVFISHTNDNGENSIDDKLSAAMNQKRMDVYAQITEVNPLKGEAKARIEPWPLDDSLGYRYRSGWMPVQDMSVHVDAIVGGSPTGDNLYNFKKNVPVGGFDVTIDEKVTPAANIGRYPFDQYRFEVPISASYTDAKGATQDLPILPQDYTKKIDTFDISMKHVLWTDSNKVVKQNDKASIDAAVAEYNTGISSSIFDAKRSNSTKLLTLIILVLMLTALGSVATMAFMVASTKRPPTLSALTWSAALTFSLISLRGLFPGSPPIGVIIDRVVYFPSLLVTLVCSLSILITWTRREDYVN
jgi:Domain of unknown function (DUF4436)